MRAFDFAPLYRSTIGFDRLVNLLDSASGNDQDAGYPPYNIERVASGDDRAEVLRITLAIAGFTREQLDVSVEDNQLTVRGRQEDDTAREYLHRGIAARQFQRTFVLADGIEVHAADLDNGLLTIDLVRHAPERIVRKVEIGRQKKLAP